LLFACFCSENLIHLIQGISAMPRGRKRGPSKSAQVANKVARATMKRILALRATELANEIETHFKSRLNRESFPDQAEFEAALKRHRDRSIQISVEFIKNVLGDMVGIAETKYNEYGVDVFNKSTLQAIGIEVEPETEEDEDEEEEGGDDDD
jgi:hypothetical protein